MRTTWVDFSLSVQNRQILISLIGGVVCQEQLFEYFYFTCSTNLKIMKKTTEKVQLVYADKPAFRPAVHSVSPSPESTPGCVILLKHKDITFSKQDRQCLTADYNPFT